jgi:hypothetical protein
MMTTEQAHKIKHKAIPEVLVYHDDESIYFECRGKDDGLEAPSIGLMVVGMAAPPSGSESSLLG